MLHFAWKSRDNIFLRNCRTACHVLHHWDGVLPPILVNKNSTASWYLIIWKTVYLYLSTVPINCTCTYQLHQSTILVPINCINQLYLYLSPASKRLLWQLQWLKTDQDTFAIWLFLSVHATIIRFTLECIKRVQVHASNCNLKTMPSRSKGYSMMPVVGTLERRMSCSVGK